MFRPTALRLAANAAPSSRVIAPRAARPVARSTIQRAALRRSYATEIPPPPPQQPAAGGGGNGPMFIVLAAILGVGVGGYIYLKPVRDVAAVTHQSISAVKDQAGSLGDLAGYAKAALPPGAFALYSTLASQPGGINGFLSGLKDKDLQSSLDELKKVGGDDISRIVEKVQKKLEQAKGNVQDLDWRSLAEELKDELPAGSGKMLELLIGKIPDKADIDALIKKAKEMGEDQIKQVEAAASKVLKQVEKAKKDGKGQADAFLAGLKETAPADVDSLIKQLKDAAKKAGLPADTAEAWLKTKVEDGKVDAEQLAKQFQGQLKTAAQYIPGEPKDLVEKVEQVSPSLAKLLAQALQQAGIADEKLNKKK